MTADPYIDPRTGILINKLGIVDEDTLREVTADISAARITQLTERPLAGAYDLAHLREFHRRIFGDVFPWAGQIRTVQISKLTGFCLPQHIESYAAGVFDKLARTRYLRGLERGTFVQELTFYHAEINELHPFREGNGRAQRAFLRQLAAEAGYRIDWTVVDPDQNVEAAVAAHVGDLEPLRQLLRGVVRPLG